MASWRNDDDDAAPAAEETSRAVMNANLRNMGYTPRVFPSLENGFGKAWVPKAA
jgi:hypothetical protein